ncbi:class I SAM-dependent methyltransferase [Candidatus Woesearchaeota archaeon]|nr:class I SAM-dependent methyltransferase [Candidatus Woesearchaeota archaeon]
MPHYYDPDTSAPIKLELHTARTKRITFDFYSCSGIFSVKKLDNGTKALIEYVQLPEKGAMLDLGCGYGVVGIAVKLLNPDLEVDMSDVNERAVFCSKKNCSLNKVECNVMWKNVFRYNTKNYDCILTNPPYVAGRKVVFDFIDQSFAHLNEGGNLQLVYRYTKGGKVVMEKMKELFGNVETLGKQGGFRVFKSIKKS